MSDKCIFLPQSAISHNIIDYFDNRITKTVARAVVMMDGKTSYEGNVNG